jgi:uncharacterized membrane protein
MTDQPFAVPAVLMIIVAIPLAIGVVPRNRWYGIRTAQTLSDDGVWYRANKFGGISILISGTIYFVVAAMYPTPKPAGADFGLWLLHLGAFALPLAISMLLTVRHVKGLPKRE